MKDTSRRRFLTLWHRKAPSGKHKLSSGRMRAAAVVEVPTPTPSRPPPARPPSLRPPLPTLTPPKAQNAANTARTPNTHETPLVPFVLRPPGALPELAFVDACQRSGACVKACPVQAIALVTEGPGKGTPFVDPAKSPCIVCADLACTHACPTGALRPLSSPSEMHMGTAQIDATRCTAHRGLPCRICYEVCPVADVIVLVSGKDAYVPVAGEEPCVGCGACQFHCPAEGAIRIVPAAVGTRRPIEVLYE